MSGTSPREWQAVKSIFLEAVELDHDQRDAFLARACGDDIDLRAQVESLLAAHHDERPFLETPPVAGAAQVLRETFDETEAIASTLPSGTRIGQYEVLEPLGSGGMGDVYRAHDTKLDRFVALKIVVDSATDRTADRVLREGRAASALSHPNICTLYEVGEFGDRPYLAMEYIDGRPLSSAIPPEGFEPTEVVKYGVQIADALAHAHERGVIHRDLKAANVVLTPQGRAKVLDFGIAKRLATVGVAEGTGTLTETGTISGTLAYIAPERLRDHPADARSDIWALGVLLYEMASGRRPFAGDTPFEVSSAILKDSPAPLPARVPAQLRHVILKCLEREPANRFQQASDVVAALERHEHGRRLDLRSILPARRIVLAAMAATLLVAALAILQWLIAGRQITTLAVLPFTVLSGTQDIEYLGLAVPDNIISRVALVRNIHVMAKLERGKENEDTQATWRKLGVDYVLTGTILQDGDRIRITPRLVRIGDGAAIPTRSSTLPSNDLLRVQDETARAIVDALSIQLTKEDRDRVEAQSTQNAEAYAAYLRGRAELAPNQLSSTEAAVAHFQDAVDRDANFVLAYAGLAMASARLGLYFAEENKVRTWQTRARVAANQALRLDPELAQSHEALAAVFRSTDFEWKEVINQASLALHSNPTLDQSRSFLAAAYMHLGLLDRASSEARLVMELNQANVEEPLRLQGASALYGGRFDEALALFQQASKASNEPVEWYLAYASYYAGRKEQAEDMLRKIGGKSARSQRRAQATLASFLAARGQVPEANQLIAAILAGSYMDHHVAYSIGAAYAAQLDRFDEALKWLSQSWKSGFECYPWFEQDSLLDTLRKRPAFQAFLDGLKEESKTTKAQYPADR